MTMPLLMEAVSDLLVANFYRQQSKIGGQNIIVEVDESKFGKHKYHRGYRVDAVWIVGMVESTAQCRILLFAV